MKRRAMADVARLRWTDDRLDDRFRGIDDTITVGLAALREDVAECRAAVRELTDALTETATTMRTNQLAQTEAKLHEREELAKERKSDRRFLITTLFTATGLLVAAIGILAAAGVFG